MYTSCKEIIIASLRNSRHSCFGIGLQSVSWVSHEYQYSQQGYHRPRNMSTNSPKARLHVHKKNAEASIGLHISLAPAPYADWTATLWCPTLNRGVATVFGQLNLADWVTNPPPQASREWVLQLVWSALASAEASNYPHFRFVLETNANFFVSGSGRLHQYPHLECRHTVSEAVQRLWVFVPPNVESWLLLDNQRLLSSYSSAWWHPEDQMLQMEPCSLGSKWPHCPQATCMSEPAMSQHQPSAWKWVVPLLTDFWQCLACSRFLHHEEHLSALQLLWTMQMVKTLLQTKNRSSVVLLRQSWRSLAPKVTCPLATASQALCRWAEHQGEAGLCFLQLGCQNTRYWHLCHPSSITTEVQDLLRPILVHFAPAKLHHDWTLAMGSQNWCVAKQV